MMEGLMACRVCLVTDVKLFDMYKNRLVEAYQILTSSEVCQSDGLPHQLCSFCSVLLMKSIAFKNKCGNTQDLLKYALLQHTVITTEYIRSLDRNALGLVHPYCSHKDIDAESDPVESTPTDVAIKNEIFPKNVDAERDSVESTPIDIVKNEIFPDCTTDGNITDIRSLIKFEKDLSDLDISDDVPLSKKLKSKKSKRKKKRTRILDNSDILENDLQTDYDSKCNENNYDLDNNDDFNAKDEVVDRTDNNIGSLIDDTDIEIVHLTQEQQIEEIQSRKSSLNYMSSLYKCDQCFKGFITDSTFKNHMARHDSSSGEFACPVCHTRWIDSRALRAHVTASHERNYVCKRCGHVAKSSHRAKEHQKWHFGFTYICRICGASFDKSTSHLTHLRTRHPSRHRCAVCGEGFLGEYGLRLHAKKAHRAGREDLKQNTETECDACKVQFRSIEALRRHRDQGPTCDKNVKACAHCGDNFANEELLAEHSKEHQKGTLKCDECNRTFAHARSHSIHYQRVHMDVRAKPPPHAARHSRHVVCEICGRKFVSNAALVYHQRTHTGEKPYQCAECPKSFSMFQRLQIHVRTHTGERPFQCSHCPKAFKHKAALNRHNRVHTGAKPYVCPHCGKSFSQSNSMKTHVNTVHLKMPAPYRNKRNNKTNE